MRFYDNYVRLCAERGESPSGAAAAIGLSNAAATGWKKGKAPSDLTLAKLAEHFACPVSELIWDRAAFSDNLVRIMASNGKSTAAFAAALSVPKERVMQWLNREAAPSRDEKIAIADRFGYELSSLDQELIDKKIPASQVGDGAAGKDLVSGINELSKDELLALLSAITDRLKEL